jgi:hypothetical protein
MESDDRRWIHAILSRRVSNRDNEGLLIEDIQEDELLSISIYADTA